MLKGRAWEIGRVSKLLGESVRVNWYAGLSPCPEVICAQVQTRWEEDPKDGQSL